MKKTLYVILLIFISIFLITKVTGQEHIYRVLSATYLKGNTTANINDLTAFNTRLIQTSSTEPLPKAENYNSQKLDADFEKYLQRFGAAAYLVIQDGFIVHEQYFNDYHNRSKTNSFSVAKTVLTMLVGIAIEEGILQSLNQKIIDFIPEFKADPYGKSATIEQLSLMNSGYEWHENYYTPFSPTVKLYYGKDVNQYLLDGHFSAPPGSFWEYSSASTQLLGIVLQRALQKSGRNISLSEYLSESIWQPLKMNDDALWHTDEAGMELVYCCINTNARNFAKLGLLMLNHGNWQGRQIIPASFVKTMLQANGTDYYGYSIWLNNEAPSPYFWFSGHLGQYIIVMPKENLVIVRLGESRDESSDFREVEIPALIEQAMLLVQ